MTETKIAQENVEQLNDNIKIAGMFFDGRDMLEHGIRTHLSTLRRWLDFLGFLIQCYNIPDVILGDVKRKITDIKNAISVYKKEGLK